MEISKAGKVENLARADNTQNNSSQYTEVWANFFEAEGKMVYTTEKDTNATQSWNITEPMAMGETPWGLGDIYNLENGFNVGEETVYMQKVTKIEIRDNIVPQTTAHMFEDLYYVTSIEGLDKILNNVTTIGEWTFTACGLKIDDGFHIDLSGTNITTIGDAAFYHSALNSIVLPSTLKKIESDAFGMTGITSISIPNGVTEIGETAFYSCENLIEFTIPKSVKKIGMGCFANNENLAIVNYNAEDASDSVFFDEEDESMFLPFEGSGITTLNIGEGVKVIPDSMFEGLVYITSISLPSSLEEIGIDGFSECFTLEEIRFANTTNLKIIEDGAFGMCLDLEIVEIPIGVTTIGKETFMECKNLTEVTISNTVNSIGKDTFRYCENLEEIVIYNTMESSLGKDLNMLTGWGSNTEVRFAGTT